MLAKNLSNYKVDDLPLPRPLIALREGETLFHAIDVLASKHVLSVPVLTSGGNGAAAAADQVLGIVSSMDIIAEIAELSKAKEALSDMPVSKVMGKGHLQTSPAAAEASGVSCWPSSAESEALPTLAAQGVAAVRLTDSLATVLKVVSGAARRAVVLNEHGQAESLVTQSMLLQFLLKKSSEPSDVSGISQTGTLQKCGTAKDHCSKGVACVHEAENVLKAFEHMSRLGVSALAIVNDAGAMVSVISATDLVVNLASLQDKTTAMAALENLSVLDLVSQNRQKELKAKASTVTVRPETSIEQVLEKLAVCHVHRVVVCADSYKPLGILSLTDICKALLQCDEERVAGDAARTPVSDKIMADVDTESGTGAYREEGPLPLKRRTGGA